LLGEVLRTSRLALLFGETGSGKTTLLKSELMPLLRRRASDRLAAAPARNAGVVVPFPDRRDRAAARASRCERELIVYFDDWTDTPLAALHACIHRAAASRPSDQTAPPVRLGEALSAVSSRLDATIIILLDRFEEFLRAPSHEDENAQFANELIEAINQARLPANFLISLNEEARPQLARLRSRIPGFDDFSLTLTRPQGVKPEAAVPKPAVAEPAVAEPAVAEPAVPDVIVVDNLPVLNEPVPLSDTAVTPPVTPATCPPASRSARAARVKLPPPARVPVKTKDVYAFIEATLTRTPTQIDSAPLPVGPGRSASDRAPAVQTAPARSDPAATASAVAPSAEPLAPAGGAKQKTVFEWVARHLQLKSGPDS
jgi:hypothetical protein